MFGTLDPIGASQLAFLPIKEVSAVDFFFLFIHTRIRPKYVDHGGAHFKSAADRVGNMV